MIDPNGGITIYEYDELNRLVKLTNPLNQVTEYSYDKLGRRTNITYANDVITTYYYDDIGNLLSLVHKKPTGEILASFEYTYDKVGNRLTMTTLEGKHEYTYDKLYQLTKVVYPDGKSQSFTYDAAGNRLRMTTNGETTTYSYDEADRLTHISHPTSPISYQYDNNGNMISKIDNSGTTTYQYDYENRLTKITYPDGKVNAFAYCPLGKRIMKADSSGTITYFYDAEDILCEYNNAGSLQARYTHGPGIDEPVSMTRKGANSYYHADGLGSIVNLTNASGDSVASYRYEAFGKIKTQTGNIVNPFRFTGREWDDESELYYYRARYYEPGIGRFIQADPIGIAGGINFYVYVGNNPINFIDPMGLDKARYDICKDDTGIKKWFCEKMVDWACSFAPFYCCDVDRIGCLEKINECNMETQIAKCYAEWIECMASAGLKK
jgi:RHS repeat-associated protein